jgi:hypothetical protein
MPPSAKKRTKVTKQQEPAPTAQTSNFPAMSTPAPAPSTPPIPAPTSTSHQPITDDASIERLIGLAKDSPPDSPLGIVWRYAFEEGRKFVDGMEISEVLKTGVERGYKKGIEDGRAQEKCAWSAAGHNTTCITVARPPRGVAVQTDEPAPAPVDTPLPPTTSYDDANTQTPLATSQNQPQSPKRHVLIPIIPHRRVSDPQRRIFDSQPPVFDPQPPVLIPNTPTPPIPFNWAEDAASLPILPTQPPPRNLSVLRSSCSAPFSSLQRRKKRFRAPFSLPSNHYTSSSTPFQRFSRHHPPPVISPHLDWSSDPRLSDLSRSLKALGWIRAP